jgi:hypothetical protein
VYNKTTQTEPWNFYFYFSFGSFSFRAITPEN